MEGLVVEIEPNTEIIVGLITVVIKNTTIANKIGNFFNR